MEFRILGPLEVLSDGRVLELGGQKQRALLTLLLMEANRVVSSNRLGEALWEEEPPETARKALQVYVSQLRKLLGRERLQTKAPGYFLRVEPEELDLARFQRLQAEGRLHEALTLWRGRPLAEFADHRFAQTEIARLEELRLACLEERLESDLTSGRHAELVGELEVLVKEHPLRERLRGQLMLALYRSGRQAEALEAYQAARGALVDELGLDPSATLRGLEQAILRQDRELDLARAGRATPERMLPTGTVTFLVTDIESSTASLNQLGAEGYAEALEDHRRLMRGAFTGHSGIEVDMQGDAFLVAFARATDALGAAAEAQAQLAFGRLRVRMGLHTGEPLRTSEGYVGIDVHRTARLAAAGHGGQVLLSQTTRDLVEVEVRDLGLHRLKDLGEPMRLYQLGDGEFPPLRTLRNVRLPVPATAFLGRERELESVVELLMREDVRVLTLTGPGGTGKTRLALQAAAEAADRYPDGIWWVPLAPLRTPALLLSAVAQALEVKEQPGGDLSETLSAELAGRRALLLLDNAEHLLPDATGEIARLAAISGPALLVTSRERLQLKAEQIYPVPTLAERDAIELFLVRARALEPAFAATEAVGQLCSRLDNLPLALELAAARTTLFAPEQLLERLAQRLDLFRGGRDADPRQQTLRATIEWSYDLLSPEEQRLFRSLAVFAGGCSYEAAEEICGADPDTLQSLLDKSLLRRRGSKFGSWYWMLETIREYAAERLERSGTAAGLRRRQAEWCCALAGQLIGLPGRALDSADGFERVERENDNVRSVLRWAWAADEDELGLRLGAAWFFCWFDGARFRDAVAWLDAAAERVAFAPQGVQLQALKAAGLTAFFVLGDTEQADRYWARAQSVAEQLDETDEIAWIAGRRAGVAWERGDLELACELHEANLAQARASGNRQREAGTLHQLGEVLRDLGRFDEAEQALVEADLISHELGQELGIAQNTHSLGDLALDRGDLASALSLYRESIAARPGPSRMPSLVCLCVAGIASVLVEQGQEQEAATLWGAACAAEEALGFRMLAAERRRYETRLRPLESTPAWSAGRNLTLHEAVESIRIHYETSSQGRMLCGKLKKP